MTAVTVHLANIGHPPKNVRQSIKARRERNGS